MSKARKRGQFEGLVKLHSYGREHYRALARRQQVKGSLWEISNLVPKTFTQTAGQYGVKKAK